MAFLVVLLYTYLLAVRFVLSHYLPGLHPLYGFRSRFTHQLSESTVKMPTSRDRWENIIYDEHLVRRDFSILEDNARKDEITYIDKKDTFAAPDTTFTTITKGGVDAWHYLISTSTPDNRQSHLLDTERYAHAVPRTVQYLRVFNPMRASKKFRKYGDHNPLHSNADLNVNENLRQKIAQVLTLTAGGSYGDLDLIATSIYVDNTAFSSIKGDPMKLTAGADNDLSISSGTTLTLSKARSHAFGGDENSMQQLQTTSPALVNPLPSLQCIITMRTIDNNLPCIPRTVFDKAVGTAQQNADPLDGKPKMEIRTLKTPSDIYSIHEYQKNWAQGGRIEIANLQVRLQTELPYSVLDNPASDGNSSEDQWHFHFSLSRNTIGPVTNTVQFGTSGRRIEKPAALESLTIHDRNRRFKRHDLTKKEQSYDLNALVDPSMSSPPDANQPSPPSNLPSFFTSKRSTATSITCSESAWVIILCFMVFFPITFTVLMTELLLRHVWLRRVPSDVKQRLLADTKYRSYERVFTVTAVSTICVLVGVLVACFLRNGVCADIGIFEGNTGAKFR